MIPVILAAAVGLASATGAWLYQENRYEAILAERTAEYSTALAAANANALAQTVSLQKAKDEAERKAQIRITAIRRDAAASQSALVGLSEAADTALRSASHSHSACQRVVTAYADIQQQCSTRLVEVGTAADRASSEVMLLRDAWPTSDQ